MNGAARSRKRLGIVVTELGRPSEIWIKRQAEGFKSFEPVFFAFGQYHDGYTLSETAEIHLLRTGQGGLGRTFRRVQRKLGLAGGALTPPAGLAQMRETLLSAKLDAVLCHFAWNAVSVEAAVGDALPIVCHVHGRDVSANLRWKTNRRALERALPRFAGIVAVGHHQATYLQSLSSCVEVATIPCGAPLTQFATRPVPLRQEGEPVVFVMVGRVSHEKGQLQTIGAFEILCRNGVDGRLVIIGDGPLMETVRDRVAQSPEAERISLTGFLGPDAVADHLTRAHVFLQHSRPYEGWLEGFGVTVSEAGAAGLPIVASASGGILDQMEDGKNGFLYAPDDVETQAAQMLKLATDEPLRREMGEAARTGAMRFDSSVLTARLEDELLGVIGADTSGRGSAR